MYLCWSVKGGSGTTVVSAALALELAHTDPTLLIDLDGDLPALFGVLEPRPPGVLDWMQSAVSTVDSLERLSIPLGEHLRLVPRGTAHTETRWSHLAASLGHRRAVIDAGLGPPAAELAAAATHSLLVIRPCYLALRRALLLTPERQPTAVIVVAEPGRALGVRDVERTLGLPVAARIRVDPAIARAVDSGMVLAQHPRGLLRQLRQLRSAA